MQAVRDLDYQPNMAAQALAKGKTSIIAVVFPYVYETIFEDPLVMSTLKGIETVCTQQQYNLLLSTPEFNANGFSDHYLRLIQSGTIDGLIAIDNVPTFSAVQPAIERDIAAVVIGNHPAQYSVRSDDGPGAEELTRHVLSMGHRELGMISVPEGKQFAVDDRVAGIRSACVEAAIPADSLAIRYGDYSIESGYTACRDLLAHHPNITAIISVNDRMAMGAIKYLRDINRNVPDDCVVVGFDNIPTSAVFSPSLTTVDQQATEQGRIAAGMLLDILNGNQPESVVLPTHLIIRESSQPRQSVSMIENR